MNVDRISIGRDAPSEVNAIIEVPLGGEPVKYELDKAAGILLVDRFLHTAMRYPGNYGFVPQTMSEDGDPCDVLVVGSIPVAPGALVAVRPVGVLMMEDENGPDEKIVAVPVTRIDRDFEQVRTLDDLPLSSRERIQHFFAHYKDLEGGKWVTIKGWGGVDEARELIAAAARRHDATSGEGESGS